MIQRTQFNRITLDRIREKFSAKFPKTLDSYLSQWEEWAALKQVENRLFYISINSDFEVDGILFYDSKIYSGTIFALNEYAAKELFQKAEKNGLIENLNGDPNSIEWVQKK